MMNKYSILLILPLLALSASAFAAAVGNVYPLPKGYQTWESLQKEMQALSSKHPDLVTLRVIGFSGTEKLPIHALCIGTPDARRKVLIIGQHHGSEVLGVETALAWARELAVNYKHSGKIKKILAEFEFTIIPTLNPEGYRVVTSGQYQFKRKNNQETDGRKGLDWRTDGVDLNRNYPVFWEQGAVVPGSHENFKGSTPMSEAEVKASVLLAQENNFELAIFFHSSATGAYSEKIFLPAIDSSVPSQKERYDSLLRFAQAYAKRTRKAFGGGRFEVATGPSSREGNARNYFFHIHYTGAFLVEIGGINPDGISVIHPPDKMRKSITGMHVKALRNQFYRFSRGKL